MRLDKFLWCLRYYKTRNAASQACRLGRVKIDDVVAKPSRTVYPSNKISLNIRQVKLELEVLAIPRSRVGAKLVNLYRKDITAPEVFENKEKAALARIENRKSGTGRPTKKERRDLDEWITGEDNQEE